MTLYNPDYLNNINMFNSKKLDFLDSLQKSKNLNLFLNDKKLNEKFSFDFIHSSSQIEGNSYTKAETLSLLDIGITAGGKKFSDAVMILNLREIYNEIINNDFEINKTNLHHIHSIIAKDLVKDLGIIRKSSIGGITGSSYLPLASGDRLNAKMNHLLKQATQIQIPFNKAVYLHNNIAYLQYFEDANKRTTRTMQFISLKNDKIMPLILINDDKILYDAYRSAMVAYYESGDYTLYKDFL
ncbi:Fic family protein [Campylobacter sp. LR264d]|nr:Fic family protein [Campylobacter sp. LR264d]